MGQLFAMLGGVVNRYQYKDLDAAGKWACITFIAPASGTIQGYGIQWESSSSGAASAEVYAVDSNGLPTGSAIASKASTYVGSYSFPSDTFSTTGSVVAGTRYALVIKRTAGAIRPHYQAMRVVQEGYESYGLFTYDSGATWQNRGVGATINIKIGDVWYGTYVGRISAVNLTSNAMYSVSGSRLPRLGIIFKALENCYVQRTIHGLIKTGAPTGYLKGEIFNGTTLVATSVSRIGTSDIGTIDEHFLQWNSVELAKDTVYRLSLTTDGYWGDASNYIYARGCGTTDSTTHFPSTSNILDGMLGGCWSTADSSTPSWTDYQTQSNIVSPLYSIEGILKSSSGGSGGVMGNPDFSGGVIRL